MIRHDWLALRSGTTRSTRLRHPPVAIGRALFRGRSIAPAHRAPETTLTVRLWRVCAVAAVATLMPALAAAGGCTTQTTTQDITACAQTRFAQQDRALNRVYQTALAVMAPENDPVSADPSARQLLIQAQRQWVMFRDADCRAMQQIYAGGSIASAIYLQCLAERSAQRMAELDPAKWQAGK